MSETEIPGDGERVRQEAHARVADSAELYEWAKRLQAPIGLVQEIAMTAKACSSHLGHFSPRWVSSR